MEIAIINGMEIVSLGDYHTVFPNTSFTSDGPSDEFLLDNNAKKVSLTKDYQPLTQCLMPANPYIEGDWVYKVKVRNLTVEEIQSAKDIALARIRQQRDMLLALSDWTQLVDTPTAIKTAWAGYRQELRDLPATITEPRTFTEWPHDPRWVEAV